MIHCGWFTCIVYSVLVLQLSSHASNSGRLCAALAMAATNVPLSGKWEGKGSGG